MKNILRHIVVMLTTYLILTLFIVRNLLSTTNFILTEFGDLIWSYLMIIAISIENFYFVLIIILYIAYYFLFLKRKYKLLLSILYVLITLVLFSIINYFLSNSIQKENLFNISLYISIFSIFFGFIIYQLMKLLFNNPYSKK